MKIITDNKTRPTLYSYELTKKEREEFDYMDDETFQQNTFIRYMGNTYCVGDFMFCGVDSDFGKKGWHGYESQSYFSGVLIKVSEHDADYVIMGRYSC